MPHDETSTTDRRAADDAPQIGDPDWHPPELRPETEAETRARMDAGFAEIVRAARELEATGKITAAGGEHVWTREALDEIEARVNGHAGRHLVATLASEVTPRRVRWLWDGRIPLGGLCLCAGREGIGKSTVAIELAARVTRGELEGEHHGTPRNVIIVSTEDERETTIIPRLIAAGADLGRVIFIDAVHDGLADRLVLPLDHALLAAKIAEHEVALVILDAATSVIDARLNGDRDREMRQGLEAIAANVAAPTGCAVLGIVHFGKRESSDTGKLILGSIAWSQVARSVLAVAVDPETDELVITPTKHNLAEEESSIACRIEPEIVQVSDGAAKVGRVRWTGRTARDARDLLGPEPGKAGQCAKWLRDLVLAEGGSVAAGMVHELAARIGYSESTVGRARKALGLDTDKGADGWVWTWPTD